MLRLPCQGRSMGCTVCIPEMLSSVCQTTSESLSTQGHLNFPPNVRPSLWRPLDQCDLSLGNVSPRSEQDQISFLGMRVTSREAVSAFKAHSQPPTPSLEVPSHPGQTLPSGAPFCSRAAAAAGFPRGGGRASSTSDPREASPLTDKEAQAQGRSFPRWVVRVLKVSTSDQ